MSGLCSVLVLFLSLFPLCCHVFLGFVFVSLVLSCVLGFCVCFPCVVMCSWVLCLVPLCCHVFLGFVFGSLVLSCVLGFCVCFPCVSSCLTPHALPLIVFTLHPSLPTVYTVC